MKLNEIMGKKCLQLHNCDIKSGLAYRPTSTVSVHIAEELLGVYGVYPAHIPLFKEVETISIVPMYRGVPPDTR